MEYYCNICNKKYVSYKSLWNHNRKFHKVDGNKKETKTNTFGNKKETKTNIPLVINESITKCKYCDKNFTTRQSTYRHMKHYCKEKKEKNEMDDIKNKVNEIEKIIKNNKLNKTNNINNGSINNGNITNNIQINSLGTENIIEKLTEKEKLDLLTDILFKEIPHVELVRKIFNNEKFVEDRNTIISNLQTKTCLAYNDENNKFEAKNKNEHIDNIIYYRHKDKCMIIKK